MLGHVLYSPPISPSTGDKSFMEDWALIELDDDKISWANFQGNKMYLGMFFISQVGKVVWSNYTQE